MRDKNLSLTLYQAFVIFPAMEIENIQQLASRITGSRRKLAKRLSVDETTLSRWLSGTQAPQHPGMLSDALRSILAEQFLSEGKPEELFLIFRQNNP